MPKPGFRRSCRAPGAAGAASRRLCCCCWAGGCSAPLPPRVSPATRPTRALSPPIPDPVPVPSSALLLNLPPPSTPTLLLSRASVAPRSPPSSAVLRATLTLTATPKPSRNLTGSGRCGGPWETDIPSRRCGAPGPWLQFLQPPSPQGARLFPDKLSWSPPRLPIPVGTPVLGGWRGTARPLPIRASAGSALPCPRPFSRRGSPRPRRSRPETAAASPLARVSPFLGALRWERGVRWAGVPSPPSRRTLVGAGGF